MRVTFVLPVFVRAPSGGFRVVYEYANRLAAWGHQVTVVHEQWREGWGRPVTHLSEIARDRWHSRRPDSLAKWLRWMTIDPRVRLVMVNKLEPDRLPTGDVVVATFWTTARLLPHLAAAHGRPVHLVQEYEIWGVPDRTQVDAVLRYDLPKIAVSQHLSGVMQRLGVPREQITVVPNGLDHSVFHPPVHNPSRGDTVGMLLSSSDQKDSATGLAALTQVRQRVPGLVVNAFGVDRRPRRLPSWIRYSRRLSEHALAKQVYHASAVYLCSSASEGWALPPAEAMACGAAVVSTRNGGIEDYAIHDQNALLVDVGSTGTMADAVTTLLRDVSHRTRLVAAGYRTTAPMEWSASATAFLAALHAAKK